MNEDQRVLTPQELAIKAHVMKYCNGDSALATRVAALAVATCMTIYEQDRCGLPLPNWYVGSFEQWAEMWQSMPYLRDTVDTEIVQVVLLTLKKK